MEEDKELLAELRKELTREIAFQKLVMKYQERVYGVIRRMLISHDETNDAMQETFIKAWRALDSFKGNSGLFTWLYRIAVNEALQALRRHKRRRIILMGDNKCLVEELQCNNSLDGDEVQLKLQMAILKLPDKQRLVFNLKYYEELTYHQMAEILGGSTGSLKASYHHAVKKIENFVVNE